MGILTEQQVVDVVTGSDATKKHTMMINLLSGMNQGYRYYTQDPMGGRGSHNFPVINVEAAKAMYQELREFVLEEGYACSKVLRPYEWTPVTEMGLDPTQPWWGFEFETGYVSKEARKQALEFCWDNFDNVTFDGEGEGKWISEVTFAPANMSSYLDGSAPGYQYMKYLSDNRKLTNRTSVRDIGTHINISIPSMRGVTPPANSWDIPPAFTAIQKGLNYSLYAMPYEDEARIFGRSPTYAGFGVNMDSTCSNFWVEGKVFRTTYDIEVLRRYIVAASGITRCMQFLEENPSTFFISNFAAVLSDETVQPISGTLDEHALMAKNRGPFVDDGNEDYSDDDDDYYYDDDDDYYYDDCNCYECREDRGEV